MPVIVPTGGQTALTDIAAYLFVKSSGGACSVAGSGDQPVGITRSAVKAGDKVAFDQGPGGAGATQNERFVPLTLGGTVRRFEYLKPDASGRGVAAVFSTDKIGARALEPGTSGQRVAVEIVLIDPNDP